LQLKY